jgi:hypothetical protein
MATHGAHRRDPITGEGYTFVDPNGRTEWTAQRYYELATRHLISFKAIFKMVAAVLQGYYDLQAELEAMRKELERDEDLLRLKLPIKEALAIWCRAREGLLRLAELFPDRRKKIVAQVAENEDVLLAMLERYERKQARTN